MSSAKVATGISKTLKILELIKKDLDHLKFLPKVYVMGCTNSGKSSLINSMIFRANKYKDPFKVHYRTKYNILTESALPGTTLEMMPVEQIKIGYKVLDTPGIPNLDQVSSHVADY